MPLTLSREVEREMKRGVEEQFEDEQGGEEVDRGWKKRFEQS